jgi:beta-phosphoglucomutase-like phosphatase (HAD superfamily)
MVKLIIFDFDGVIITGSNEGYFTCYHKALEAIGVKYIIPDITHLYEVLNYFCISLYASRMQ